MGNIKIGDWVTQYRTGYWMVKELHPKFSPFEVGTVHKGDWQGYYAVLQKAFGSTFKFGIAFDTCDASLCTPVSKEQLARIETYFEEHPKDKLKFESAKVVVPPSMTTVHLQIDDQQQAVLSAAIERMLPTLTLPKLRVLLAEHSLPRCCRVPTTPIFICMGIRGILTRNSIFSISTISLYASRYYRIK